jgi:Fe-S-cluster containining protein
MIRLSLPMADQCAGCGRCCETIGLPPFEAANPDFGPQKVHLRGLTESQMADAVFDTELYQAMPQELRATHAQMLLDIMIDPTGQPCAWYDAIGKRCWHHDWRPATCRRFQPAGEQCVQLVANPEVVLVWQEDRRPDRWRNPRS